MMGLGSGTDEPGAKETSSFSREGGGRGSPSLPIQWPGARQLTEGSPSHLQRHRLLIPLVSSPVLQSPLETRVDPTVSFFEIP